MAFYKFLRGNSANLANVTIEDGAFYLTTDTHRLYVGQGTELCSVNEGVTTVANVAALPESGIAGEFYYATEENVLCVFNGKTFVQINPDTDTGATSVAFTGEGSVIVGVEYDATTRKLTFTKSKVAEGDLDSALATKINGKLDASEVTGDLLTHNASEFATAAQGAKADSAVQKITVMGTELTNGSEFSTHEAKIALGLGSAAYTDATAYATAEQGAKADSAVQSIETGNTNGTIKVDGNEVSVAGLGSAAYTNATAYATAEQGAKADTALQASDIANKADKADTLAGYGIGDAYTKDEVATLIQEAKDYADDNDANATYSIEYDKETDPDNPVIKLVGANGGVTTSIPAKEFIKDGMLDKAEYDVENNKIVLTWNTDAGKETMDIDLNDLVDTYTGEGAINVSADGKISIVDKGVTKAMLEESVQESLAKADSALQSHQDISHLATKTEVQDVADDLSEYVTAHAGDYTNEQVDTKVSTAISDLKIDDYVKKTEANGYGDILTKTDAATLYATVGHNHDDKYDAKGSAEAVQGLTDKTVKDVVDLVGTAQQKADEAYELADSKATMAEVNKAITDAAHASQADLVAHTDNADIHVTTDDKAKWNASEQNAKDYADSLAVNYDASGSAAQALIDAKKYTDEELTELLSWGTF